MKKLLMGALLIALCGILACDEEEVPGPQPQTPLKEATVEVLVANAWDPGWSPDGKKLVYVEAWRVVVRDLTTETPTAITPDYGSSEYCPRVPVWLAGDKIAFLRKDEDTKLYDIYVVPAAGGEIVKYEVDADADSGLAGSIDGRFVYFTNREDLLLYRYDLEYSEKARITNTHMANFGHFDAIVKPNTNKLLFEERAVPFNGNPHAEYINEVIALPGYAPTLVYQAGQPFLPGLTVSPDGAFAVFARKEGLYAADVSTSTERWLTRASNTWADKDRRPAYSPRGDLIAFTRAGDICTCEGL